MFRIVLLSLLVSFGTKNKVDVSPIKVEIPKDFTIGPDFEKAAIFCDEYWGYRTAEARACFKDYTGFFSLKLDISSIVDYCKGKYVDQAEVDQCEEDIRNIFSRG